MISAAWLGAVASQPSSGADDSTLSLFPIGPVWTLPLNNALVAPPAYSASHAYFPIEGDRLVAYEWEQGRRAWIARIRPAFEAVEGDGLLFVATSTSVTALRTEHGLVAWDLPVGALAVPPVWGNGWLVLATEAGELLALRASDGHVVWRLPLGARAHAAPSLAANRVYVATEDGRLTALHVATGEVVWEQRLAGPVTGLLAAGDRIYAGSRDNFFYSLRESDGTVDWRWRTGADVVGVPVVDDSNVYFVSMDNVLRGLSRGSGVQQWVRLLPLRPTRGPLAVGRTLIVSGVAPLLPAYHMSDGARAGELPAAGELAGAPGVAPSRATGLPQVLVVTRDLAKGATATLFRRQRGPALSPFAPPPGAIDVIPLPDARKQ